MEDRKLKEKMSGYEDGESSHAPRSRTMGSDGEDGNRSASAGAAGTLHIQGASPREILPALFLACREPLSAVLTLWFLGGCR